MTAEPIDAVRAIYVGIGGLFLVGACLIFWLVKRFRPARQVITDTRTDVGGTVKPHRRPRKPQSGDTAALDPVSVNADATTTTTEGK